MLNREINGEMARRFGEWLKASNYTFIYNSIAGTLCTVEPWVDETIALEMIAALCREERILTEFLLLGMTQKKCDLEDVFGEEGLEFIIESGLGKVEDDWVISSGFAVLPVSSLYLIVSLPSNYKNAKFLVSDIYIGSDSTKLMKYVRNDKFDRVLDLCAGSGVQGFHLVNQSEKVISVELNDVAYSSIIINQKINGISFDKYEVRKGDLYSVADGKFDCIVCNPPFVPVPKSIKFPMCGDGGEDGLDIVRRIVEGYHTHLNDNGKGYMVLECVGNDEQPFVLDCMKEMLSKGIINISLLNRQPIELQADASAKIAIGITQEKDHYQKYFELFMDLFNGYKATFIYPVVIEYIKCNCELRVNYLGNYHKWSLDSQFAVAEGVEFKEAPSDIRFTAQLNGQKKVAFDQEVMELLYRNQNQTVRESLSACGNSESLNKASKIIPILNILHRKGIIAPKSV